MTLQLVRRRTMWWPTFVGWVVMAGLFITPVLLWCFMGEPFLATTQRKPAEILVVEGWIGIEGVRAAKNEFLQGHYQYIVTTSGLSGNRWDTQRWNYATEAEELLLRLGLQQNQIIVATPQETEGHRTYESALATKLALDAMGLHPKAINVFTLGVHARRSRLVYAKVHQPATTIGVIAWPPPGFGSGPWWQSSNRTLELLKETTGYIFEVLLNSGRSAKPEK